MQLRNGQTIIDEHQSYILSWMIEHKLHTMQEYPWDEPGTAMLFIDIYHGVLRYCPQQKLWYVWDTNHWDPQSYDAPAIDKMVELIRLMSYYAMQIGMEKDDPYRDYIKSINRTQGIKNVITLVKAMNDIWIRASEMNRDPWILNTRNTAYNLRTGETISNEDVKAYCLTKVTGTSSFTPGVDVECQRWYSFIGQIMDYDIDKIGFLKRALGYSLLGTNAEECMFIAYGQTTRNGKGTLFSAIQAALGRDYCSAVSPKLICEQKAGVPQDYNAPQPALAKLVGTRIAIMSEASKEDRLDAAGMKAITGRDELMTRELYGSPFVFTPQFTMWMNTNYLPNINDATVFSSNRIWVIEFNRHFDINEQDRGLKEELTKPQNLHTIMRWLLEGCREYLQYGLMVPECVKDATERYRALSDRLGRFISECCEIGDDCSAPRGDVYSTYCAWCHRAENRYQPMGSTSFYAEMSGRGYHTKRTSTNRLMTGLQIRRD